MKSTLSDLRLDSHNVTFIFLNKKKKTEKRAFRRWWVKPGMNQGLGNLSLNNEFNTDNDLKYL